MKGVIIQGSSRSDGNTARVAAELARMAGFEVIHLCEKEIGHFIYERRNHSDEFVPTIKMIIGEFETLVFATPVYWYSMSGLMKNFVDRFTDLLRTEKELGRRLRGKKMAMLSCGSEEDLPSYFEGPFEDTAGYLGMVYLGSTHTWVGDEKIPKIVTERLTSFAEVLMNS